MTRQTLVVGAGIGGLACAIDLARAGVGVTVLERAARPGGKMREAAVAGVRVDAGPTVFTMRWVFDALFEAAGSTLECHIALKPLDVLARHAWSGAERLDLFADVDRSAHAIGAFAGAREAAGYHAFCAEARRIFDTLRDTFLTRQQVGPLGLSRRIGVTNLPALLGLRPFDTLWTALGGHFRDPRLRQLFGRYATYCGSSPFAAPATLMLIAHVEQEGVWTVEGGMQRLADALETAARSLGVQFRYGAHVRQIDIAAGRAYGVTLASGERLSAFAVVANAGAAAIATGAFGEGVQNSVRRQPVSDRSLSAVTWAVKARTKGFPLIRHNVFFSDHYRAEFEDIFTHDCLPRDPTIYVCAEDRSDDDAKIDGAERLLILVNAPANGDRNSLDEGELSTCERQVFDRLARCGLTVEKTAEATTATTPRDFNALFPATGGALYGQATHGWAAAFRRPGPATKLPGLYLAGAGRIRGGRADGGLIRTFGRGPADAGPRFDVSVPAGGYRWWYVDALSQDGRFGVTVIAFIGSVFSPYYAWSGRADPLDHCAVNVALYRTDGQSWAMTERRRLAVRQAAEALAIGPSRLSWEHGALTIDVREITAPILCLAGTIRLRPTAMIGETFALDGADQHLWRPVAPRAEVEVSFTRPASAWRGQGYFDTNWGGEPLEDGFVRWDWLRAHRARDTLLFYDVERRDGEAAGLALRLGADSEVETIETPARHAQPPTFWRMPRQVRADAPPVLRRTLEDAPFYSRSAFDGAVGGEGAEIVHESLSLDRLRSPVVRAMLPFRMPRRFW